MKSLMRFRGEMCPPGNALLIFCGAAAAVAAAMATLRERTGGDPIQDFHILLCTPGKVCALRCHCVLQGGFRNVSCCFCMGTFFGPCTGPPVQVRDHRDRGRLQEWDQV